MIGGMAFARYRHVLALPGVARLTLVAMLGRIPLTSIGVVLTLHVVLGLDRGYGPAGVVGGAATVGAAIGAPMLGRIVDLYGLRRMLVLTTVAEGVFWFSAPWLSFAVLVPASFAGGVLALPIFSVVRQALAAVVPEEHRRTAYSLDSMSIELSFMIGPLLAVLVATLVSTGAAMLMLGALIVAAGIALYVLNPPVRGTTATEDGRPPVRSWLRPALISVLLAPVAATLVLAATDVAIVATLQSSGQVPWVGLVLALWGLASLLGGFVYGAMSRGVPAIALAALLGVCTVPVGLLGNRWWLLSIALLPAGALCAPTLAAVADEISRLAPESVRGVVMGLHSSALTAGFSIGAPLGGTIIDLSSPAWAFAVAGATGTVLAVAGYGLRPRARLPVPEHRAPLPTHVD